MPPSRLAPPESTIFLNAAGLPSSVLVGDSASVNERHHELRALLDLRVERGALDETRQARCATRNSPAASCGTASCPAMPGRRSACRPVAALRACRFACRRARPSVRAASAASCSMTRPGCRHACAPICCAVARMSHGRSPTNGLGPSMPSAADAARSSVCSLRAGFSVASAIFLLLKQSFSASSIVVGAHATSIASVSAISAGLSSPSICSSFIVLRMIRPPPFFSADTSVTRLRTRAPALTGRHEAHLVQPVVEASRRVLGNDADLDRERRQQRKRQIAVRDRAAERAFAFRAFHVHVNPLRCRPCIARTRRCAPDRRRPSPTRPARGRRSRRSWRCCISLMLMCLLLVTRSGELLAQPLLVHLADTRLFQRIDELDDLRHRVLRDLSRIWLNVRTCCLMSSSVTATPSLRAPPAPPAVRPTSRP